MAHYGYKSYVPVLYRLEMSLEFQLWVEAVSSQQYKWFVYPGEERSCCPAITE